MTIPGRLGKRGYGGLPSVLPALLALFCWIALTAQLAAGGNPWELQPTISDVQDCKVLRITSPTTPYQLVLRHADINTHAVFAVSGMKIKPVHDAKRQIILNIIHPNGKFDKKLPEVYTNYLFGMEWEVHPSDRLLGWCECKVPKSDARDAPLLKSLLKNIFERLEPLSPPSTTTEDEANTNEYLFSDSIDQPDDKSRTYKVVDHWSSYSGTCQYNT